MGSRFVLLCLPSLPSLPLFVPLSFCLRASKMPLTPSRTAAGTPVKGSPAAQRMAKYMVQVSDYPYLQDYVQLLSTAAEEKPNWEQDLISAVKTALQDSIDEHFKKNGMARQKFASMPEDSWKDMEGRFILTEEPRPLIGYLDKKQVAEMNKIVKEMFDVDIAASRIRINKSLDDCRASDADRQGVEELLASEKAFIIDVETHRTAAEKWEAAALLKLPILATLKTREEFLEEVDHFEQASTGDKSRFKGGNSLKINDENKFRAYAAKHLRNLNEEAIQILLNYRQETGADFEVDGVSYLKIIKEQKFGRPESGPNLARKPADKIDMALKKKYNKMKASGLVAVKPEDLKLSLYELGIDTNKVVLLENVTEEFQEAMSLVP